MFLFVALFCTDSCSMLVTGDLYTWGAGGHGRLGLGNTITWNSPQLVKEISGIKQVSVAANHMLALDGISTLRLFICLSLVS
jgi:alpha-tubulin suppressor-like RCC1 family protein